MSKPMTWNVRVKRGERVIELGQVMETSQALARCAALSRFGIADDERQPDDEENPGILPEDEFEVMPDSAA